MKGLILTYDFPSNSNEEHYPYNGCGYWRAIR